MNFLINLIAGAFLSLATLLSPTIAVQAPVQSLGGVASFNPVQSAPAYLSGAGVSGSATSIPLTNFVTRQLTPITTANIGGIGYATIDPGTSKEENISFTGVTQNSNGTAILTGVTRGLQDVYPYTGTSTLSIAHSGGATVITSNSGAFYSQFNIAANTSTITGNWTFASSSLPSVSSDTPTSSFTTFNLVDKQYADALSFAGVPNGSVSTKGIYQEATAATIASGTVIGTSGADLTLTQATASTTGGSVSSSYSVVESNGIGTIDKSWVTSTTISTAVSSSPTFPYVPVGTIDSYISSTAPNGWLEANGSAYSTSTYPALFSLIGYTYGSSTGQFLTPNLGGRFLAGASSSLSTTVGATGGATSSAVSISVTQTAGTYIDCHNIGGCLSGTAYVNQNTTNTIPMVPPYFIVNYIIKY